MKLDDIEVGVIFKVFKIDLLVNEQESKLFGYFLDESIGLELTRGKGWYVSDGTSSVVHCIKLKNWEVVETENKPITISYCDNIDQAKKYIALSKLTDQEKKLLGI